MLSVFSPKSPHEVQSAEFFYYHYFSVNDCYSSQKSDRKVPFLLMTASELLTGEIVIVLAKTLS